ncbi:MAG: Ti-type conjugative transfer relaxase TraA [Allosphingosinicella sp.]|uniref:Ti-type conjugative transfer relaxase TraA n=1 Tax=Allosphingosinicella sp. TaxID=2823234 RepID=UPI003948539A
MAIYHFSAKVISRAAGSSALAAAAYRSASRLHDQRLDRHHDFSNKAGVIHSEVMLPDGAPGHLSDRERLWNEVEAAEKRIDAQLAREIEFALPRELSPEMGIDLARDFVGREFVNRGMVADLNVHWDVGADGQPKPHAHVMLSMREVGEEGFGAKMRDWNRTDLLQHWREAWADHVNERLAQLDIDARIDHRSLEAQGIDLEPQNKIGPGAVRMAAQGLQLERVDEHREIARSNGEKLLERPALALEAITHGQATFTTRDLAMFVHRHSEGKEQFDSIMAAVRSAPELIELGKDGRGDDRFTSRDILETERRLELATVKLEARRHHPVSERQQEKALARAEARGMRLSVEQRSAFDHVTDAKGLSTVIGYAGTGKSAMLGVAREAWEEAGYQVRGAALSGIAAENLEGGSGIRSRTMASLEHQWAQGRELLGAGDVLVIDEAGMIGTRPMERVLGEAEKRGAKVVLVGDPEQLQAIEAGAAFRSVAERHGSVEITDIRRQQEEWQRSATRQLATGRADQALASYERRGHVHAAETRDQARAELIDSWDRDRSASPEASRIILTHTNDEVQELNGLARERLRGAGELGEDVVIQTARGSRDFAAGDRIMFLRNERSLGVKNGSLGRVEVVTAARMNVLLDDGRQVGFDFKDYGHVDHGYAATVHKAQGVTVDRTHVLATPGLDRHAAYVALSRHRSRVDLHYGEDDFADRARLVRTLGRDRPKDMASDYAREFAERRQIRVPEQFVRCVSQAPTRDPFAEFGSELAIKTPAPAPDPFTGLALRKAERPSPEQEAAKKLNLAVQRYARAAAEIVRMRRTWREELPHQLAAYHRAGADLDRARPFGARDMTAAFNRDGGLIEEAAKGRTQAAIRAMVVEGELRTDPERRAERFVGEWRKLSREREVHRFNADEAGVRRAEAGMTAMGKQLQRDPQLESLLRTRTRELGIEVGREQSLSRTIQDWFDRSRQRGIGR